MSLSSSGENLSELSEKDLIKEWLKSKQTTIWGHAYNVIEEVTLEQAADWWQRQMWDFHTFSHRKLVE